MRSHVLVVMAALLASGAHAAVIYDNGEFITHPGYPAWSECCIGRNVAGSNFNSAQ